MLPLANDFEYIDYRLRAYPGVPPPKNVPFSFENGHGDYESHLIYVFFLIRS